MKIILKDSLTGLYYSGNQTWCAKVLEAMDFDAFHTAAWAALEEKLETVNVVLRFEEPECELAIPLGLYRAHLSRGPKEHHVRPAIDPLFRSAAQLYGRRAAGVLLSGTSGDGVAGLQEIKRHGGLSVVQEPAEAMYPEMPRNALAKVEVDDCLPVTQIRDLVTRWSLFGKRLRLRFCQTKTPPVRLA